MTVRVQSAAFDSGHELSEFSKGCLESGAVASFTGLVRADKIAPSDKQANVTALTLEHYPGMTERMLMAAESEARKRWNLEDVLIIHRFGRMGVRESIVFVAAAATHRENAFAACTFLMDWLKTNAPFWKYEETESDGETRGHWVTQQEKDIVAAQGWTQK